VGVKKGNLINSADFSVPWELICCKSLILLGWGVWNSQIVWGTVQIIMYI